MHSLLSAQKCTACTTVGVEQRCIASELFVEEINGRFESHEATGIGQKRSDHDRAYAFVQPKDAVSLPQFYKNITDAIVSTLRS